MNAPPPAASDENPRMKTALLLVLAVLAAPRSFSQEAAPKKVAPLVPKIYVTGEVRVPQALDYNKDFTLGSAIGSAGGCSDFGRLPVYLIRYGAATRHDLTLISRGKEKDPPLLPWDVVHVGN